MERRVIVTEADVDAVVRAVEARVERYAPGFAGTACGANAARAALLHHRLGRPALRRRLSRRGSPTP